MSFKPFGSSPRSFGLCAGVCVVVATATEIGNLVLRRNPESFPKQITSVPTVPRTHRSGRTHFDLVAKLLADDRRGRDEASLLRAASDPASEFRIPSQPHELLDQRAPSFTLLDSDNHPWSLGEKLEHGPVVLVFYLNYGCDACVTGLFELNTDFQLFQAFGTEVAAISDDATELTQRRFQRYGKFSFPVLSDPGHTVAATYSIFSPARADHPEQLVHGIFVIGQDRHVKWAQTGDAPFTPNAAVLSELASLERTLRNVSDGETTVNSLDDQ